MWGMRGTSSSVDWIEDLGDKEEKNKKTAEKQSILDGLEEHRKNECAEVGFFNTYFLC